MFRDLLTPDLCITGELLNIGTIYIFMNCVCFTGDHGAMEDAGILDLIEDLQFFIMTIKPLLGANTAKKKKMKGLKTDKITLKYVRFFKLKLRWLSLVKDFVIEKKGSLWLPLIAKE